MRVVSLIFAIVFAVGGARSAWACPTQAEREGCCCERARAEADEANDARRRAGDDAPRLERACCCKADTGAHSSAPSPSVEPSARERLAPPPAATPVPRLPAAQPAAEVIVVATSSRGPPRQTLFAQHTLLLS